MKPFKVAVTFGRFNLLHKGHLDLFKQMAESAKEIVIGVSTGPDNLTYRQRADVIIKALNDANLGVTNCISPRRQPFGVLKECLHLSPEEVVFFVGEDQYALAKSVEHVLQLVLVCGAWCFGWVVWCQLLQWKFALLKWMCCVSLLCVELAGVLMHSLVQWRLCKLSLFAAC